MSAPELVRVPSFDGRAISALVYWPPPHCAGRAAAAPAGGPVPVVVHPHGGPEGQHRPTFSPIVQCVRGLGFGVTHRRWPRAMTAASQPLGSRRGSVCHRVGAPRAAFRSLLLWLGPQWLWPATVEPTITHWAPHACWELCCVSPVWPVSGVAVTSPLEQPVGRTRTSNMAGRSPPAEVGTSWSSSGSRSSSRTCAARTATARRSSRSTTATAARTRHATSAP